MPPSKIRAIDPALTTSPRELQRDPRRFGQKVAAACRNPHALGIACWTLAGLTWVYPAGVDLALLGGAILAGLAWRLPVALPFKLPQHAGRRDPHELQPGTRRRQSARGILYIGNDRFTREELYLSDEDARTHFLLMGGTGGGKTAALVSLALGNALVWGSGCTYVDGKGQASLWATFFAMARACGREDDVYVLNYLTGSTDIDPEARGADRLSNTFNPFSFGSADALTQMLVAQMSEAGGDAAPWKDKAIALLTAYVRALVSMRDQGTDERGRPFSLDVRALRAYLPLDRIIDLYLRARETVDGFALPGLALTALQAYLESVPGYQDPVRLMEAQGLPWTVEAIRQQTYPPQPDPQTYLQHGYLQNQFNRMFGQLADVYGHIFQVQQGEIDLTDVVLQRRLLVVMLPALEKSPDELASLGKLLIASLKNMLAVGLGARLEGTHRAVIERQPTHAPSPYFGAFDEYGYYAVEGFAVVPAQARSLGFSVLFAGQDIASFGKKSKEEADAILSNTLTKIGLRIEDPKDTTELFEKSAGSAPVSHANHMTRDTGLFNTFHETPGAHLDSRQRIEPLDLREQLPGEAHIVRGATLVRADLFFAGTFKTEAYRINRFSALEPPDADALRAAQAAVTPDGVRRAETLACEETVLEPWRMDAVRQLADALPPAGPEPWTDEQRRAWQTFAQRFLHAYCSQHALADAALAAAFQTVGTGAAAVNARALPAPADAGDVETQRAPTPPGNPVPEIPADHPRATLCPARLARAINALACAEDSDTAFGAAEEEPMEQAYGDAAAPTWLTRDDPPARSETFGEEAFDTAARILDPDFIGARFSGREVTVVDRLADLGFIADGQALHPEATDLHPSPAG